MQSNGKDRETSEMDERLSKNIPALFALAHDRSESGRVALADKLAEVFLTQAAALTAREEEMVNALIVELIRNGDPSLRHAFVAKFEEAVHAPRPLALKIVRGPVEIAHPLLVANENLSDDDLISIVQDRGVDHAAAIAARAQISEAVADALVTTGDLRVMQLVAENLGARLSANALDVLIDSARLAAMLQKPILSRPELSAESAVKLYWWVAKDLRVTTLERFGFGPGKLDAALGRAIEEKLHFHMLQKEDDESMASLADWLEERGAVTPKLFPQLLRLGHYRLFNLLFGRLARLDSSLIDLMTSAPDGKFLVVLCRAVGVEKGNFVSIFLMSRGSRPDEHIVRPHELSDALATFDKIDVETAQAMIDLWRINPADLRERARMAAENTML